MARRVATTLEAAAAFRKARRWLLQPGSGRVGAGRWRALSDIRKVLRQRPYIGPVLLVTLVFARSLFHNIGSFIRCLLTPVLRSPLAMS